VTQAESCEARYHGRSDIAGLADPAERSLGFDLLTHLAFGNARSIRSFGLDHAGVHAVDANLARPEFRGQQASNGFDRRFRAAVNGTVRKRPVATTELMLMTLSSFGAGVLRRFLRGVKQAEAR
jgi:hypothetical protein